MAFDDPKPVFSSPEVLKQVSAEASSEISSETLTSSETLEGAAFGSPITSDFAVTETKQKEAGQEETGQKPDEPAQDDVLQASSQAASTPLSPGRALGLTLATGLIFALVGLLVGLRVVAAATLPHILQPGEYINFMDVSEGLPVPRLLAWDLGRIDFLDGLRGMSGLSLLLPAPLVFGPLWLLCVRRVNPTFRLFGAAQNAPAARLQTRPATPPSSADTLADPSPVPDATPDATNEQANAASAPTQNQDAPTATTDTATAPSETALRDASVTSPASPRAADTLGAVVEFYGLMKALTLLLMIGLGIAAVWILVDFEGDLFERGINSQMLSGGGPLIGIVWMMRLGLLGAAFWVGFHRDGIAGDFTQPDWNTHSRRLFALGLQGLLFGLLMYALCRAGLPQHLEETLLRLQTLGALSIPLWAWVTRHVLLCFGGVGFAIGAAFALFSSRDLSPVQRLLCSLLPLAGIGTALIAQRGLAPAALAARFDVRPALLATLSENAFVHPEAPILSVPDGLAAAGQLARMLHLKTVDAAGAAPAPGRTLVLFDQNQPLLVYQNSFDIDNLPCDTVTDGLVLDFLRRRDYQTAFSWLATKHLFNAALVRLDNTEAMRAGILDLTHSPHNTQFGRPTLLPMFSVCAATPQNLALLNQWADETKFETPDRNSRRLMGDLFRRIGKPDDALRWYRKADMPASFLKRVSGEKPVLSTGQINGVLRLNGRPLAGVQVAVIPVRLNGLPRGLEEGVLSAPREVYASNAGRTNPAFGLYHPQPYSLRWISASATTDAQGNYHIGSLTEGEYVVICTLPRDIQTRLPIDDRLRFAHTPAPFTVNYRHPTRDMGTTDITYQNDAQPSTPAGKQP